MGTNGIGKSTALKILSGKLKPNLGKFEQVPDWETILAYFRGSELQNYFTRIVEEDLKAVLKPQYVDHIPRAVRGPVIEVRMMTILSVLLHMHKLLDTLKQHQLTPPRAVPPQVRSGHAEFICQQQLIPIKGSHVIV